MQGCGSVGMRKREEAARVLAVSSLSIAPGSAVSHRLSCFKRKQRDPSSGDMLEQHQPERLFQCRHVIRRERRKIEV